MKFLIDTNILLRIADASHPMHQLTLDAVDSVDSAGHECVIVPQVLYEYWVVATRPRENNGLGLDSAFAELAIGRWIAAFELLLDGAEIFRLWLGLVIASQVKRKVAHDARLVAAMQWHQLTHLLTFNASDFARFDGIQVVTPPQVLAAGLMP